MLSRRTFITGAVCGAAASAATGAVYLDLATSTLTGDITVEEITLTLPGLSPEFDGYKIAFLTDIHLGIWLPSEWIVSALDLISSKNPDILALGGDYILLKDDPLLAPLKISRNSSFDNLPLKQAAAAIYREVASIISRYSFRDGTVGITGNHDHWLYFPVFASIFSEFSGIKLLINQTHTVNRKGKELCFFGVDDYLTGIPTWMPPRVPDAHGCTRVLLSHNPDYVSALLRAGRADFDVALCGHTHGGQVRLPGFGPLALQIEDPRLGGGLVRTGSDQYVYTSRGLGLVGLPFRFNCPPEVTVVTLRALSENAREPARVL